MKNPKQKGNKFEKDWAEYIKDIDSTASRNYGSGAGLAKSDVHNSLGYEFECKHVESLNIWKAIEEAERHAEQAHTTPAIVFRRNRMPEPYVAIPAWHWKELYKKSKEPKTDNPDRELSYLFQSLVTNAKKIIKKLEK